MIKGRFICKWVCPLGLLQSLVNRVFHPKSPVRRVCTRLPQSPTQLTVRYTILATSVVLIGAGFGGLGWFLNPISILGKAWTLFLPGLIIFIGILLLAALTQGRFWCNWVCPVGTVLELLAKLSPWQDKVGKGCSHCQACFAKADCPKAATTAEGMTRREALQGLAVLSAVTALEKTTDGGFAPVSLPGVPKRPSPVLPPAAKSLTTFNRTCIGCSLCMAACRGNCLKGSLSLARLGQPEMNFQKGYCLLGCDFACGRVCPTGAINWQEGLERRHVHMGHAIWKKDLCIRTTTGDACTACVRKCPVDAIKLVEGFPVIDKGACIGCGACEHVCPARPMPAIFVKGFETQRRVRPISEDDLIAEMKTRLAAGVGSVVAKDGVIIAEESGRGVSPLLRHLEKGRLRRAVLVDKVIGRATAAMCVVGQVKRVHAALIGADAIAFLAAHNIPATGDRVVPQILNPTLTAPCIMEAEVANLTDPQEMVNAVKAKLEGLKE